MFYKLNNNKKKKNVRHLNKRVFFILKYFFLICISEVVFNNTIVENYIKSPEWYE